MARTATEYSNIIKAKEQDIDRIKAELETNKREGARLHKHVTELEADVETLSLELDATKHDHERDVTAQSKVQNELDQLRGLLQAKTSEETRRSEVDKRKEEELITLRSQVTKLQNDIADSRTTALETQNKLKVDLDTSTQEHKSLQQTYQSLLDRERLASGKLKEVQATLTETEKTKRSLDSELQSLRSRQFDTDTQLADATRAKEVLIYHLVFQTPVTIDIFPRTWNDSLPLLRRSVKITKMPLSSSSAIRATMTAIWNLCGSNSK